MIDKSSLSIENKAVTPPVYGPGLMTCPACKTESMVCGRSVVPIECPNCKTPMIQGKGG